MQVPLQHSTGHTSLPSQGGEQLPESNTHGIQQDDTVALGSLPCCDSHVPEEGIKVAHQLTISLGDYPGSQVGPA